MSEQQLIHYFCKAIKAFKQECPEMQDSVMSMADIINDPASSEDDKSMAANTLENILFPPRGMADINAKMEAIPYPHRLRWCESSGMCACMGCANSCGVTKNEWRKYGKSIGLTLSAWGNLFEGIPHTKPPGYEEHMSTRDDALFSIRLIRVAPTKQSDVIRVIRRHAGYDLMTAFSLVRNTPRIFMDKVQKHKAIEIKNDIEAAGGEVDLGLLS